MRICENNNNNVTLLCVVPSAGLLINIHRCVGQKTSHCHGNILSDLSLPKFSDRDMQNVVQYLSDFDSYFFIKNVPESIRLPLARKAVVDGCASQ